VRSRPPCASVFPSLPPPAISTLFPYTTLFRSGRTDDRLGGRAEVGRVAGGRAAGGRDESAAGVRGAQIGRVSWGSMRHSVATLCPAYPGSAATSSSSSLLVSAGKKWVFTQSLTNSSRAASRRLEPSKASS